MTKKNRELFKEEMWPCGVPKTDLQVCRMGSYDQEGNYCYLCDECEIAKKRHSDKISLDN